MIVHRLRVQAAGCVVLALAALAAGCARDYSRYSGDPMVYSTHPWRILVPASFARTVSQQTADYGRMTLGFFSTQVGSAEQAQEMKLISVRCHKLRKGETTRAFVDRFYDELAPLYLDVKARRVPKGPSGGLEYIVSVNEATRVSRLIPLPKERLVYEVQTNCPRKQMVLYDQALQRARDSFRILPARR